MEQFWVSVITGIIFILFVYFGGMVLYSGSKTKLLRSFIAILVCTILLGLNVYACRPLLTVFNTYILVVIFHKIVFQKSFIQTLIGGLWIYICTIIVELGFTLFKIFSQGLMEVNQFLTMEKLFFIVIFYVIILSILVLFQKYFRKAIKWFDSLWNKELIAMSLVYFCLTLIFLIKISFTVYRFLFIEDIIIIMFSVIIMFIFLNQESKKEKLFAEYDRIMNQANYNEQLIEEYRVSLQQQRNEFIAINSLLKENKRQAKKYVEELITARESIISEWLKELKNIPSSNLKGLISYKMLEMKNKMITTEIAISSSICNVKDFDLRNHRELYTIVGFLLDRAIEECQNLNEKMVSIQMYQEKGKIHLVIANTYSPSLSKIKKLENGPDNKVINRVLKHNCLYQLETRVFRNFLVQDLVISL